MRLRAEVKRRSLSGCRKKNNRENGEMEMAVAVGARYGKPVVYRVNAGAMNRDGCVFYHSASGVWLTDRVPKEYPEKL